MTQNRPLLNYPSAPSNSQYPKVEANVVLCEKIAILGMSSSIVIRDLNIRSDDEVAENTTRI